MATISEIVESGEVRNTGNLGTSHSSSCSIVIEPSTTCRILSLKSEEITSMPHVSRQDQTPVEWITHEIIRQYFNNSQIFDQVQSGQLDAITKRSSHPENPPAGEPVCTRSQIVYYYTKDGKPVAIVHQYLRPDGTIGASGRPDPKRLFLADRIISVRSKPPD